MLLPRTAACTVYCTVVSAMDVARW